MPRSASSAGRVTGDRNNNLVSPSNVHSLRETGIAAMVHLAADKDRASSDPANDETSAIPVRLHDLAAIKIVDPRRNVARSLPATSIAVMVHLTARNGQAGSQPVSNGISATAVRLHVFVVTTIAMRGRDPNARDPNSPAANRSGRKMRIQNPRAANVHPAHRNDGPEAVRVHLGLLVTADECR